MRVCVYMYIRWLPVLESTVHKELGRTQGAEKRSDMSLMVSVTERL